jgi:putative DNA primase/helicase
MKNEDRAFLEALVDGVDGWIEVRPMKQGGGGVSTYRAFCQSVDEAVDAVTTAEAAGLNVYVGVATRSEEGAQSQKGTKQHLAKGVWFWVDIDAPSAEADERLAKFEDQHNLRANMVVRSSEGGGLHAYFRCESTIDLSIEGEREWLENVNRGLVEALDGDPAAVDSSRVMRVPGTTNRPDAKKRAETGRGETLCTLLRPWDRSGYPRERFEAFAKEASQPRRGPGTSMGRGAQPALAGGLSDRVRELIDGDEALRDRFNGVPSFGQNDESESGIDFSLACMLAWRRVSVEEIAETLKASRGVRGATERARDDKLWRTAINAVVAIQKEMLVRADHYAALHYQATRSHLPETVSGDLDAMFAEAPPASLLPSRYTDSHVADAFRRGAWGQDVLYSAREKSFRAWDGRCWSNEYTNRTLERCYFSMVSGIQEIAYFAQREGKGDRGWSELVEFLYNTPSVNHLLPRLKARLETESHEFDAHPWLLNVGNGVLDLRTKELLPHDPALRLTMLANADWVEGATCEDFDRFLETSLPDESVREFVQRVAGLALIGVVREKHLTFFCGPKDSGKSLLEETLNFTLGNYSCGVPFEVFLRSRGREAEAPSPMVAQLPGKRLVFASEVNPDLCLDVAQVKRLTGRDELRVRTLYGKPFPFRPAFTLLLAANEIPQVEWTADAVWERLHVVEFTRPDQLDPELEDKLRERAPSAVLWWAFQGLQDWRKNGLQVPNSVRIAVKQHRESMDPLKDFLDECCVIEPGAVVPKKDLYQAFCWFVAPATPMSEPEFGRQMKTHGFKETRPANSSGRQRCWADIRLATNDRRDGGL